MHGQTKYKPIPRIVYVLRDQLSRKALATVGPQDIANKTQVQLWKKIFNEIHSQLYTELKKNRN